MTQRAVLVSSAAEEDLRGAFLWYLDRNQSAAKAFRVEAYAAIEALATLSNHLAPDDYGIRRRVLKRYPYSVIYRLEEDCVTVVAVAHHRRRPGYWR